MRADSMYVRLVGRCDMAGSMFSVAASGGYAYVANGDTLRVVSTADPAHPFEVGSCGSFGSARGIAVGRGYAYVAVDVGSSLRVISVADPANPTEVGRCSIPGTPVDVAVHDDYVCVAAGDSGLRVISVADPAHPVEVGRCGRLGYAYNVAVNGVFAYLAAGASGMRVISVADPVHPTEVGSFAASGEINAVAADGHHAYVAVRDSTFRVVSVADPANPVEVGQCYYSGNSPTAAPQDLKVIRGYAFLGTWWGGLRIIDIANPARPAEVGHYRLGQSWSVALDGDYVYFTAGSSLYILQFYQLGDLDVDDDSLDVAADTLRPRRWTAAQGGSLRCAWGEFMLANTSASYNPDSTDGPSVSPVDSLKCTGSLVGPGGTIDSIVVLNLPESLTQGQTLVCTLAAYLPVGLEVGDYTGLIYISGRDTAGLQVYESCYVFLSKLGDIDVDNDSLGVGADTLRLPPIDSAGLVLGEFVLANTSASYNPDTADGPSLSWVDSLSFTASLTGPGGILDSIFIQNFPAFLAHGQVVVCTLAVYMPESLPVGHYKGSIVITGLDSVRYPVAETVHALVRKVVGVLGDLDVDNDSLDVIHDTMDLHSQPAGPVYHPYAKARFMLGNTSQSYNPDTADGPSRSPLHEVEVEAKIEGSGGMVNSECRMVKPGSGFHSLQFTLDASAVGIYVLNLPESLAVGQAVECTLALVIPVGESLDGYAGWITISALDTLGYAVRDSFFLTVRGPQPRQTLDSLRVAPIPFKPHQNPEHDAIHFQGLSAGAKVIVYDASGQSVWSATESGDGHLAWKAEVASGIYAYLVVSKDGQSHAKGKLSVIR